MRSDNSKHLLAAARQRSSETRRRAEAAIGRLADSDTAVTFDSVAREAGVSRSWLYAQTDLRTEIARLRERGQQRTSPVAPPERQRASETSLLRRLEAATDRIRGLEHENRELKDALAQALGQNREATITGHTASRDTPTNRPSQVACS
jgi:hypothetical protein